MNKKGAIEFSITTIIIIIIGISILALALPWVARMMQQTAQLTDTAFEQAKTQLAGELSAANPVIVVPSSLSLAANDQTTVSIGCYNKGSAPSYLAKLTDTAGNVLTGTTGIVKIAQSKDGDVKKDEEYYWGLVVQALTVDINTAPQVFTLKIDCSGTSVNKPLTITFR